MTRARATHLAFDLGARGPAVALALTVGLVLTLGLGAATTARAQAATPEELAKRLGLSDGDVARVKGGEIVAVELEASSDKDLSLALVARIDAGLQKANEFVDTDRMIELSTVTLSHGEIDPANPSLAAMELDDETVKRLAKDPGDTFYMSEAEAERVAEAGKKGPAAALDAYRGVLAERARAYWEKGIDGIEPYAGGKVRSPKADLTHANAAARKVTRLEELLAELETAPAKSPGRATHTLSWAVQKGRDQAAPVLIHRIVYHADQAVAVVDRRFYSAYDYDSLQIVVGILKVKPGASAVFYTNHTYTSQVAGFGGGAKRSIGRKILRQQLVAEMEDARKALAGG